MDKADYQGWYTTASQAYGGMAAMTTHWLVLHPHVITAS
jgi:hypothetical protein